MSHNNRSLITLEDLSKENIMALLDNATSFEENPNRKILEGKIVATLFFEPSTRTRLSFEIGRASCRERV